MPDFINEMTAEKTPFSENTFRYVRRMTLRLLEVRCCAGILLMWAHFSFDRLAIHMREQSALNTHSASDSQPTRTASPGVTLNTMRTAVVQLNGSCNAVQTLYPSTNVSDVVTAFIIHDEHH
jgi:hypothetical protein